MSVAAPLRYRMLIAVTVTLCLALILRGSEGADTCTSDACQKTATRILEYMDSSVPPCQDFYKFACGRFLHTGVIDDDKSLNTAWTQGEDVVADRLHQVLLKPLKADEPQAYRNLKRLFDLCMDEKNIDARGVSPAASILEAAGGWPVLGNWTDDRWSFLETEIKLLNHGIGGKSLFKAFVDIDSKNGKRRVIEIDQPDLGVDRENLVNGENDPIVKAYYSFMVDIAVMFGAKKETATEQLLESLRFEIELAKITTPDEQRRDSDRMYNLFELPDLIKNLGWIDWKHFFSSTMPNSISLTEKDLFIVDEVDYLKKLESFVKKYSNKVVANYVMWRAIYDHTDDLTSAMRNRGLEFTKAVEGTQSRSARWRECLDEVSSLDVAISSLYVKNFFDEKSREEAREMAQRIRQEMMTDIKEVNWMDQKTKKQAELKASKMVQHIGYPDELADITKVEQFYKDLSISAENYFEALLQRDQWVNDFSFRQLREAVNKSDWRTHSYDIDVNFYYAYVENSIMFPAAVLQLPYFSSQVPQYVNYANIGFWMGHETTHGFDDVGSQYDAEGELKNWWEEKSKKSFEEKTKCIIDQYSSYRDNGTQLTVNGVNTQGENVADNGGIKLALRAYHRLADQRETPEPLLPGLETYSLDQLFLLSYANMMCTIMRPEKLSLMFTSDPHTPDEFRANGVLKNLPDFSEAFHCKEGDPMNPKVKCSVW